MTVTIQPGTGVFEGGWTIWDENLRVGYTYTRDEAELIARQTRARNAAETRRKQREAKRTESVR